MNEENENITQLVPAAQDVPPPELIFRTDFTVSEVRARALKMQKHRLLSTYPKALVYSVLLMIPTLLLFLFGMSRMDSSTAAGHAIEIIALLFPVIFGGPLLMGMFGGSLDITHGKSFSFKRLFFAFTDDWFTKAVGAYLLFTVISAVSTVICLIPAFVVHALSADLSAGFASIATQVIVILLAIVGMLLALNFYLRFALIFPLLIDHNDMNVTEAARISFQAMRGNTTKLFLIFFSYTGWYVLSFGVAAAVIFCGVQVFYTYAANVYMSGDMYSAYMILLTGIYAAYIIGYVLFVLAYSTVALRPFIGWAAFYDVMTGYEPPEADEVPGTGPLPEDAASAAPGAAEPLPVLPEAEPIHDNTAAGRPLKTDDDVSDTETSQLNQTDAAESASETDFSSGSDESE